MMYDDYLIHHGVKGQKWGIRRYQNPDGTLTNKGKKHYGETQSRLDRASTKAYKKVGIPEHVSGDKDGRTKEEKKALRKLSKAMNKGERAAARNAISSQRWKEEADHFSKAVNKYTKKNTDGKYNKTIDKLTNKKNLAESASERYAWRSLGQRALNQQIAKGASAAGYSVKQARTSYSFITGRDVATMVLSAGHIMSMSVASGDRYKVR